jgi:hypothetical protein
LEAVPVMQAAEQGVSRSAHGMWLRVPGRARASPRAAGCGGCGGGALVVAEVLTQDALGFSLPPSCLPPRHPRFLRVAPCCPDLRVPRGFRESLVKRRPKKGSPQIPPPRQITQICREKQCRREGLGIRCLPVAQWRSGRSPAKRSRLDRAGELSELERATVQAAAQAQVNAGLLVEVRSFDGARDVLQAHDRAQTVCDGAGEAACAAAGRTEAVLESAVLGSGVAEASGFRQPPRYKAREPR